MKKLNLKLDGVKKELTKEQMKEITGGYGSCYPITGCDIIQWQCVDPDCFTNASYFCSLSAPLENCSPYNG